MRNFFKPGIDDIDSCSSIDVDDDHEHEVVFLDIGAEDDNIPAAHSSIEEDNIFRFHQSDHSNSDDDDEDDNNDNTSPQAGPSGSNDHLRDSNLREDEDDTIRALVAAVRRPRTHPPEIVIDEFVTDISFHVSDDIIALGTITGDVLLYKYGTEENTLLNRLEVHTKSCRDIEFSEDGETLISVSKDKSIMLTDIATGKLKKFYDNAHTNPLYQLYIIDENLFTTGDDSGTVKLWDIRTQEPVFALKEVEDYISCMLTNDDKRLLLVTSGDGYLTTLNLNARKMYVQSEPYEEELTSMGLYRNDSKLIVGTSKGRLYSYKWGEFGYHGDMFPGMTSPINVMVPLTDRVGCVAGEEGVLRAAHIAPFRNLGIVGQHTMPVESMDINHSGELVASSSHNCEVRFWNIKYFEDFEDIKYNEKHNSYREQNHNLPSSKHTNASDFFSDLAR